MFYCTLAVSCLEKSQLSEASSCFLCAGWKQRTPALHLAGLFRDKNVLRNHIRSALETGEHNPEEGELPRYWMPFGVPWQRGGWQFTHTWWGKGHWPLCSWGFTYLPSDMWSEACLFHTELTRSSQLLWEAFVNFPECCLCWHRCNWSWQPALCTSTLLLIKPGFGEGWGSLVNKTLIPLTN